MRLLRGLLASLLWILAAVLGLLGALLCVTVILLPLGIPLLLLARRLFRYSMTLFLPRQVRHPVQELSGSVRNAADGVKKPSIDAGKARKRWGKKAKKAKKSMARQRKRLPA